LKQLNTKKDEEMRDFVWKKGVLRIKIIQTKMRKDDRWVFHIKNPDRFQTTRGGEVLECG
jgi:hypothetical protein